MYDQLTVSTKRVDEESIFSIYSFWALSMRNLKPKKKAP